MSQKLKKLFKSTFLLFWLIFAVAACSSEADALASACNQALVFDKRVKFIKPIKKEIRAEAVSCTTLKGYVGYNPNCEFDGWDYTNERNCESIQGKKWWSVTTYCDYTLEDYSEFEKAIKEKNKEVNQSLRAALDILRESAQTNKDSRFLYDHIYDLKQSFHLQREYNIIPMWAEGTGQIAQKIRKVCSIYK